MTTIIASTTIGVNLDLPAYTSPVAIAPGVTVSNPAFPYAVYATLSVPPVTLQNYGTITASGRAGVYLAPGGVVTNAAAGFIAGRNAAIEIATHGGIVVNYGRILGSRLTAIDLPSGGTIINELHGRIFGNNLGVSVGTIGSTIAGTVLNAGVITGGSYSDNNEGAGVAVYESSFAGATGGVVVNSGTITDPIGSGVVLGGGGTVTNMAHALIGNGVNITGGETTAATLVNDGSISGGVFVGFDPGGSVTNGVQGTIEGSCGVDFESADEQAPGTLVNDGRIYGVTGVADGVLLGGGSVTNAAGASITGGAVGVRVAVSTGTIVNSGTIAGTLASGYGIDLDNGGIVTNAASGTITGGREGIILKRGGTVINAGTIVGMHSVAISFRGGIGTNNLLVLEPGYGFSGNVIGGAANTHDAIELASAASAGTVAGLGSKFANFTSINFDPGAVWSISGFQRGLAGPISGFAGGDTIELLGVTASNPGFADDILT